MNIFNRASHLLALSIYNQIDANEDLLCYSPENLPENIIPENQYILRMMVCCPEYGLQIPPELNWLSATIHQTIAIQKHKFKLHPYIYVTVRCGPVKTKTDDVWHVDGFSMKIPHTPEQNYIWADSEPTEILKQRIDIPSDFDPAKHNLHSWFQRNANETNAISAPAKKLLVIDPYIVHRRPVSSNGGVRKMFRISHIPIEIKDDTNTTNSLFPVKRYNNIDIRKQLIEYDK